MFTWIKHVNHTLLVMILLLAVSACTVIDEHGLNTFEASKTWILLPFQNHSGIPHAGDKAEEILATLLRSKGIDNVRIYQKKLEKEDVWSILNDQRRQDDALNAAKKANFYYGITGSIEEWNYKTGVGGEPAVGLSLRIIEISTGRIVWSATGAKSGWGADTVSGTAQNLLNDLLSNLKVERFNAP